MDTPSWEPSVLLQRLDRLEAQNRFWRRGSLGLLLAAATTLLVAANYDAAPQDLLVAKRFRLVDDQGHSRVELFMSNLQQPALVLYDEKGKERATVRLTKDGPEFWLWDEEAKGRATFRLDKSTPELVYFKKGSDQNLVRLAANDQNGFLGIWTADNKFCFHTDDRGTVVRQNLQVNDQQDKSRISLKCTDDGPQFWLWDEQNRGRMELQLLKNAPMLSMFDEQKLRLVADVQPAGPQFICLNKDGSHSATRLAAVENGGLLGVWTAGDQVRFVVNEEGTIVRQALQINDTNGKPRIQLAKSATSNTFFKMMDDSGAQRILMFINEQGEGERSASCSFYDRGGQQILMNLGAATRSGFISAYGQNGQSVFSTNETGTLSKAFERLR